MTEQSTTTATRRQCEKCKGAMPDRMSRTRDESGALVCDSCRSNHFSGGAWGKHSSLTPEQRDEMQRREAEAMRSVTRVTSMSVVAHDSGDNALLNHCPFCGSGAVTGRSDGSADCDFCHTVFTVQVQPAHPNMPQTIDGQPSTPPGMPAGEETELSSTDDPAVEATEDGTPVDALGDADAAPVPTSEKTDGGRPPGEPGAAKKPNPFEKKSGSIFRTASGAALDAEAYSHHLALEMADDRDAVLDTVRIAHVVSQHTTREDVDGPVGPDLRSLAQAEMTKQAAVGDEPLTVHPWVTIWEQETFTASIAGGKVHTVTRSLDSENKESGVANPVAPREDIYTTACGTTRRGRYLRVEKSDTVTCTKCLAKAGATAKQAHATPGDIECPACNGSGASNVNEDHACWLCEGLQHIAWSDLAAYREYLEDNDDLEGTEESAAALADFGRRFPGVPA